MTSSEIIQQLIEGTTEEAIDQPEGGVLSISDQYTQLFTQEEPSYKPPQDPSFNQTPLLAYTTAIPDTPPPEFCTDQARRDVGQQAEATSDLNEILGVSISTDQQGIISQISEAISYKQVSASNFSFGPAWILRQEYDSEIEENWKDAYEVAEESAVPRNSNVIGCQTVYKVKDGGDRGLRLKAGIVLHGNRDKARFEVRRDSSSAELVVVGLLISLGVILGFCFGTGDVKGPYM